MQPFVPVLVVASLALSMPGAAAVDVAVSEFSFDVYLDRSRIGYHDYRLVERPDGVRELQAEARFDVKFLFVNAFRYRHEIRETWAGNCLTGVQARTDSNGKKTVIEGALTESGFLLDAGQSREELGECVMTFAYWNPAFLEADRLLNPQTGEFLDVEIEPLRREPVVVDGQEIDARGYEITSRNLSVRVWYSVADRRWLALESPTKGGRMLRYELNI